MLENTEDTIKNAREYRRHNRLERNGARENAGSNPEDVSTGEWNGEHQTPGGVLDPVTGEC